jgi:hypothetical protein
MSKNLKQHLEDSALNLKEIVLNSNSFKEVANYLGYSEHGRNTKAIRKYLEITNISYSHFNKSTIVLENRVCPYCSSIFTINSNIKKQVAKVTCSNKCANNYFSWKQGAKNIKQGSGSYAERLTKYLYDNEQTPNCVVCGEADILDCHHVDEDRLNNDISNLVFLCPTHHASWHRNSCDKVFNAIVEHLDKRN